MYPLPHVQTNVAGFGGDPNQVTLFGQSAGGFSVCQHLTRPASNHLFSRAIFESGGCDGPWVMFDEVNSKRWGDYYTQKIGCPPASTSKERTQCLRQKTIKELLEPYLEWLCPVHRPDDPYCNRSATGFSPVGALLEPPPIGAWPNPRPPMAPLIAWAATVDGTSVGLPDFPYNDMRKGLLNVSPKDEPISVIMGTNADEMAPFILMAGIIFPGAGLPLTHNDIAIAAKHITSYHQPSWNATASETILAAYSTGDFKGAYPAWALTAMGTDFMFLCQTRLSATALGAAQINAYVYRFDFQKPKYIDPRSLKCQLTSEVDCGVGHGSELRYMFGHKLATDGEVAVSQHFERWWSNFAIRGNPNDDGQGGNASSRTAGTIGVVPSWPTYTAAGQHVMNINEAPTLAEGLPHYSQCEVWDALAPL
jgi:carboxylesterase type B